MRYFFLVLTICCSFIFSVMTNAEDKQGNVVEIWKQVSQSGNTILKKTMESFSKFTEQFIQDIDKELLEISEIIDGQSNLDMEDKIDSIRLYVDELGELKKKETKAANFTIIANSKKDYRIKIDEVLKEIEPILFDGQIVNYAERIRQAKSRIDEFEEKKVELNEKILFASDDESVFTTSKSDLREEVDKIDKLLTKLNNLIEKLEYDLKRKMNDLGIQLTREQIRIMTTRIDGDDLAKSFAIFDVTKQITRNLAIIMQQNSFSGTATTKYYGIYVILSEILGHSQRQYIDKINETYLPALNEIGININDSITFAEKSIQETSNDGNVKILKSNIEANKFSLNVLDSYRDILVGQRSSLEEAVERTKEQIMVAYSTYDTAVNSANLINLISQTQESFNKIMDMQLPDIVPFENSELENKFNEISEQLLKVTSK